MHGQQNLKKLITLCYKLNLFFFYRWHYSPLWGLACRTMSFHFFLSATNYLHLLTPITWRSLSTSSFHLFFGLPILLVSSSSWVKMFCTFHVARVISYKLNCRLNPLNAELNLICHLLVLLGAHRILHISRIKIKYRSDARGCVDFVVQG